MLESLVSIERAERTPWLVFLWGFFITTVAVFVAQQIAPGVAGVGIGLFSVIFVMIPATYILSQLITEVEAVEESDVKKHLRKGFVERHGRDIIMMLALFAGLTAAFAVWSFVLPDGTFGTQTTKITEIRGSPITGNATARFGFESIFFNNLQVLFIAFVFALIFGAGAVFVIVWNASVLGVFIGSYSKSLWEIPIVGLSFLPHGIPEIGAYLLAGLAGGLISAAVLRKNPRAVTEAIVWDAGKLLALAVILVFIGAVVEVFV